MSTAVLDNSAAVNEERSKMLAEATARAESIKNDAPQRFPDAASVGDAVRQGDVYIQLIADVTDAPMLYRKETDPEFPMQLAPGNTKGSRHCLAHGNGVTVYQPVEPNSDEMILDLAAQHGLVADNPSTLFGKLREAQWRLRAEAAATCVTDSEAVEMLAMAGPIFMLQQENTVTHPEHGDWILPPGCYRVTYQRTVTRENTIARVLD